MVSEFILLRLVFLTRKYFRKEDNERQEKHCGTRKGEHKAQTCRRIHTAEVSNKLPLLVLSLWEQGRDMKNCARLVRKICALLQNKREVVP
jgi:hypothetical protein